MRARRWWLPWMRTDGGVAGRAYGRAGECASECASVRLPSGRKKPEWSLGKSLFIFMSQPICARARVGARIYVAEGAKQLMGLDVKRDGVRVGEATAEAEGPAKHRQLPFTFKSHKITPLTPSSRRRSSAPLSSALFSFSALLAVAQNWVFLSSLL